MNSHLPLSLRRDGPKFSNVSQLEKKKKNKKESDTSNSGQESVPGLQGGTVQAGTATVSSQIKNLIYRDPCLAFSLPSELPIQNHGSSPYCFLSLPRKVSVHASLTTTIECDLIKIIHNLGRISSCRCLPFWRA